MSENLIKIYWIVKICIFDEDFLYYKLLRNCETCNVDIIHCNTFVTYFVTYLRLRNYCPASYSCGTWTRIDNNAVDFGAHWAVESFHFENKSFIMMLQWFLIFRRRAKTTTVPTAAVAKWSLFISIMSSSLFLWFIIFAWIQHLDPPPAILPTLYLNRCHTHT